MLREHGALPEQPRAEPKATHELQSGFPAWSVRLLVTSNAPACNNTIFTRHEKQHKLLKPQSGHHSTKSFL